ncbi:carboxypeptidase-like regulatory domain-containing protein [Porphyromonas gingivicanis]|uniref:carboxypeptidase-like regulatory domain-containing protein n=1 Tax=Porphyromonas gingivicanis TaxID=266762 RepID=UPI000A6250FB|nr:carboxypeptidase-like regulatory domain-containing protein [Porphyromonas gingivicanis]
MIVKKIFLGVCTTLFTFSGLIAQERTELSGKVIDKETQEPLSYCTVFNKANNTGSISNVNGDFKISDVNYSDTIRISMVGYQERFLTLSDFNSNSVVQMSPKTIALDEVVVRRFDFKKYIPIVYDRIAENFPARYPTFDGVYRKQLLENGKYVFLGECAVSCKNTKKFSNVPKVAIGETYATINRTHNANKIFLTLNSNLILYPYFHFIVQNSNESIKWGFKDKKVNEDESSDVYIFAYTNSIKGVVVEEGVVHINASDHAILRVDRNLYPKDNFIKLPEECRLVDNKMTIIYKYKRLEDGSYALNYSRSEWRFKFSEGENEMRSYTLTNDFLVTNYNSKQRKIGTNASIDPFKISKQIKIVDIEDLKHLIPDYKLE